ncbi:MAG TPA: hypothetical protein VLJ84_12965, partial [Usitatibacter sp.]|nr:hypothetical protein [Usitatibacter sp.]
MLGPAHGPWSITDIGAEGYRLACGRTPSPFSGCGEILRGSTLVCWPMSDDTSDWSINGRDIHRSTLARLDPGVEYASLTSRPLNWAALIVPPAAHGWPAAFHANEIPHDAMTRIRGLTRTAIYLARANEVP